MILPGTDIKGTLKFANKMRNTINSYSFYTNKKQTASFGISTYKQNETSNSLIQRADKALYQAKKEGRDKIIFLEN